MTSQGSFFGSFPHIWLVHLAIITSIVTKQCRMVETHQSQWCWYVCLMMIITFFPPFVSLYWGNKETQNHMLVCQALITDRCWGTLFWGIPLHLRVFLFYSLLLFWSVIYFVLQFYFKSGFGAQFFNRGRYLWHRLSLHSFKQRCIFFCRIAIVDNGRSLFRSIWRIAPSFSQA